MFKKTACSILVVAFSSTGVLGDTGAIRFKNGPLDAPQKSSRDVAQDIASLQRGGMTTHIIVQFDQPLGDADRAKLAAAGVTLLDFLGDNGFFAAVHSNQYDAARAGEVATLIRSAEIGQAQKLHTDLLFDQIHDWMRVPGKKGTPAEERDPVVGVYVRFHSDVVVDPDGILLVGQYGGSVRSHLSTVNTLVVDLPYSQIKLLAAEDLVEWIEPPLPGMSVVNDSNRVRTGANIVQAAPYNLTGAGIKAMVYDGGRARVTHQDFGPPGRAVVGAGELPCTPVIDHATHVAGTIGGAGVANPTFKGMAPGVGIVSYGLNQGGGCSLSQGFLYTDPGDLQSDYSEAINTYGADIANNSIGTNTAPNGFPCAWEGDYGVTDTVIDSIVRGSVSPGGAPFRVVWANGNERQTSRCDEAPNIGYHKTAPPACAKNHITVGALNSNDDTMTTFSSWGPADDGRMKPDISGPGCQTGGDGGVTSCFSSSDTAYGSLCGTSMACPTVTGIASLLLQDYCAQFPARCPGGISPDMRNSMLKILLAHTAVDLGNVGPDYQFGYGSVRIQPAIDFMRTGNFAEGAVGQGDVYRALVVVNPGAPFVKITLAWDDPAGTPNVSPALVNDLDLVVFDPSSNQRFPWTLGGLADPMAPAVQTQKNSLDNIEQVYVASPPAGVYQIEVRGFSVPQGPQAFSLCASPSLLNCSRAGIAALDKPQYSCSSIPTMTVIDCDLNTNNGVVETVNVNIKSTTESAGETVTLTETGPQTALFRGTISLSTSNSPGVLQVTHGDVVTLTYIDADDGQGNTNVSVTATATVDCVAPVISNVQISNVGPRNATVTFNTNENAKGTVRYGTSCGSLTGSTSESLFSTSHSIVLGNLNPATPYFLAVDAEDVGGNIATSDNGGACYTFTTLDIPDFLTEDFATSDFDLANKSILFKPQAGSTGYKICVSSIGALPTDPAGGTNIVNWTIFPSSTGPFDDGTSPLTVSGGNTVKLHGVAYSSFYVSTNGNITFATADGDFDKTLAKHFAQPRISAFWDDLLLSVQGTCSWKELSDRFAISWVNVPEYSTAGTGPPNTFQIEMFYDGRIRFSYLVISDIDDVIVGLSAGGGLSPDFIEMDLSQQINGCGLLPPYAYGSAVSALINTFRNVPLETYDYDGDPLSRTVTSLPTHGKLRDLVAGATIVGVPYTLAGGTSVRYTPDAGYLGADSFQFKSNDGGTPTTGGDSNTATIAVSVNPALGTIFSFPVNTNQGWTVGPAWSFGTPLGGCSDPTSGFTGSNVFGNTLTAAGCYANSMTTINYLTTTAINCSALTHVSLRFRRWLNIELNDNANLQVSRNGAAWVDVWNNTPPTQTASAWSQQTHDVSAVAAGQSTVFFRWGIGTTNATTQMGGWNIDDIEVLGPVASPCGSTLRGDMNFNTAINSSDIQKFVDVLASPGGATQQEICAADCYTDGAIDLLDLDEMVNLLLNITVP